MSIPELSVLVVDDEPDAADVVARWLRLAGHHVRCAANGRQALGEVVGRRFDAVVLDLMMPDMDGPAFLDAVRSCLTVGPPPAVVLPAAGTPAVVLPVVVLTGAPDGPAAAQARRLGVFAVLVKSVAEPDDILRAVHAAAGYAG